MEGQGLGEQYWQKDVTENLQRITGGEREVTLSGFSNEFSATLNPDKVTDDLVLIGNALVGNTTVEKLCLFDLILLDERATMALANGIRQSQITELEIGRLSFVEDTPGGGQRIARIFCDSIRSSETIEKLDICCMGELRLMFSDVIIKTTSLNTFRLGWDEDGDHRCATRNLMRSLNYNSSLKTIEFSDQNIDDQDVSLLVESLHPNLPLERMSLPDNKIGTRGVQALLRAMAPHPTWNDLDLSENQTIGMDGLRLLGEELQRLHQHGQPDIYTTTPKFISVDVRYCFEFDDDDEEEDEEEEEEAKAAAHQQTVACQSAEQALLNGVKENFLIVKLDLANNQLSEKTLMKIKCYLQLNQMGRYLLGTNHGLASTIWCHVLAKCIRKEHHRRELDQQLASSVMFYFLREQPHLVMPRASTW